MENKQKMESDNNVHEVFEEIKRSARIKKYMRDRYEMRLRLNPEYEWRPLMNAAFRSVPGLCVALFVYFCWTYYQFVGRKNAMSLTLALLNQNIAGHCGRAFSDRWIFVLVVACVALPAFVLSSRCCSDGSAEMDCAREGWTVLLKLLRLIDKEYRFAKTKVTDTSKLRDKLIPNFATLVELLKYNGHVWDMDPDEVRSQLLVAEEDLKFDWDNATQLERDEHIKDLKYWCLVNFDIDWKDINADIALDEYFTLSMS